MGALRNIAIAVFAISLLTFVALFGQLPALRRTPIGLLQRILCLHLPNGLKKLDHLATGGRVTSKSKRLGHYLFYEKNPVVLVGFVCTGVTYQICSHIYRSSSSSFSLEVYSCSFGTPSRIFRPDSLCRYRSYSSSRSFSHGCARRTKRTSSLQPTIRAESVITLSTILSFNQTTAAQHAT